jgi:hypothetical protein
VKGELVARARAAGFDLTIDEVGVGARGVTLRGVRGKPLRAPGIGASAAEVRVIGLFSPKDVMVLGGEAELVGATDDLEIALATALADLQRGAGGSAPHVSVVGARVSWAGPGGDRLLAGDAGVEIDPRGPGRGEVRGSVGRFELTSDGVTYGPWSASFESTPATSRVHLLFDPPVPDGPSALVVWRKGAPAELTIKVRRSSFKNLGLHPAVMGLPASDDSDLEASVTGTLSDAGPSELTFDASAWGVRAQGLPGTYDVHLQGVARAQPGRPFELSKTTLKAGPIAAAVDGTITPSGRSLRLDATFRTSPIACERIARAGAENAGPLASGLLALGQSTGALRVKGTLNASGTVHFDTAAPRAASVAWLTREACGVSIFGM